MGDNIANVLEELDRDALCDMLQELNTVLPQALEITLDYLRDHGLMAKTKGLVRSFSMSELTSISSEKRANHIARVVGEAGVSQLDTQARLFGNPTPMRKKPLKGARPMTISSEQLFKGSPKLAPKSNANVRASRLKSVDSKDAKEAKAPDAKDAKGSTLKDTKAAAAAGAHKFRSKYFVKSKCLHCSKPFKGLFKKGHMCRNCKGAVHHACLAEAVETCNGH